MQNPMDPAHAKELKQLLRKRAEKAKPVINLSDPNNKYTLWAENGAQGYVCFSKAADEKTVYGDMRHLRPAVVILEAGESGDRVTLWTCEVG